MKQQGITSARMIATSSPRSVMQFSNPSHEPSGVDGPIDGPTRNTHTHTHTHTRTHARTHTRTHARTHPRTIATTANGRTRGAWSSVAAAVASARTMASRDIEPFVRAGVRWLDRLRRPRARRRRAMHIVCIAPRASKRNIANVTRASSRATRLEAEHCERGVVERGVRVGALHDEELEDE